MESGFDLNTTPKSIFHSFRDRRLGIFKALTTEFDEFYRQCDPAKENLCLFGLPDGNWEVREPDEELPPHLPEPVLGINFSRDGTDVREWRLWVAAHSDSWLFTLALYYAFQCFFTSDDRKKLFDMLNSLPTLSEIIGRMDSKQTSNEATTSAPNILNRTIAKMQNRQPDSQLRGLQISAEEKKEENDESCGACGFTNSECEVWICCDECERWYHIDCVRIKPELAYSMKRYKCPKCKDDSKIRRKR